MLRSRLFETGHSRSHWLRALLLISVESSRKHLVIDVFFGEFAGNEWKQKGAQRGATGGARSHLGGAT